jgi:hypothetical protein
MIDAEKYDQALLALHRVLIEARMMGLQGESGASIAEVLDWAELLPGFLGGERENTDDFRNALEAIAEKSPRFTHALRIFDAPIRARLPR